MPTILVLSTDFHWTRTVRSLVQKKYLQEGQHHLDARAKNYELNERDRSLMRAVIPDALRYEEDLLSQLTSDERQQRTDNRTTLPR